MKQIINRLIFTTLAAVAMLATGCSKEPQGGSNPDRMEIAPLAMVGGSSVEVDSAHSSTHSSSAHSRASASGDQELGLYFARADETSASTYNTYGATAITATRAAGAGEQPLSFSPAQYYRADRLKTKLTGWYPGGATAVDDVTGKGYYDGTAHTVSWSIDGQQDVMTAPIQQGSLTSAMPAMTFDHRLTQIQFYPYAQTQSAIDSWGKITKIEVLNQQNKVVYDLANDATGVVSFSGDKTNNFSAGIADGGAALSLSTTANRAIDAKQMGNPVMIVPQSDASYTLTLRITTSKNMYKDVTLTQALIAGVPYRLYMDFKELDIVIETEVTQWRDTATSDNIGGEIRIGDYMDGGLVYYIDPANPKKYKVMALEEAATGLMWAPSSYYAVSGAQSITDGKANSEAIKAAFDLKMAGIPITESTFDAAFPAAAYCYNYKGKEGTDAKGSWHLPALKELQYLYCSYNGISCDNYDIIENIPSNTTEQEKWNNLIKARGVPVGITYDKLYWSSTELSDNTSFVWLLNLSSIFTDTYEKNDNNSIIYDNRYLTRCVRDIAPPPPVIGGFKDGGIVYEVTDETKYKVMSLDQGSSLKWSVQSYIIGAKAQSTTDGKANSAAIKSYFAANAGIVGPDFSVAFPAANFCDKKNTGGVTGWYLPAVDELIALSTAYAANKSAIDAGLGTAIQVDVAFLSSTEYSRDAYDVWGVLFSGSYSNYAPKIDDNSVRCIRNITPPPVVGDFKDGGIVYEVTDATKYKVMSLEEGSNLKWSASSYTIGADTQSTTDGKANSAAIKSYFATNTATVGSDFSVAFPAANFCDSKNTGGVTGWYLPAKDELTALYTACTANKPAIDTGLGSNGGTAIKTSGYLWSSTEYSGNAVIACFVDFSNGSPIYNAKLIGNYVRCIRDI